METLTRYHKQELLQVFTFGTLRIPVNTLNEELEGMLILHFNIFEDCYFQVHGNGDNFAVKIKVYPESTSELRREKKLLKHLEGYYLPTFHSFIENKKGVMIIIKEKGKININDERGHLKIPQLSNFDCLNIVSLTD